MISPLNQAQVQGILPIAPTFPIYVYVEQDGEMHHYKDVASLLLLLLFWYQKFGNFFYKFEKLVEFILRKKNHKIFPNLCWKVAKFHPPKNIGSITNECHGYILSMVLISCEEGCIQSVFFSLSGGPLWLALNQKSCSHYETFWNRNLCSLSFGFAMWYTKVKIWAKRYELKCGGNWEHMETWGTIGSDIRSYQGNLVGTPKSKTQNKLKTPSPNKKLGPPQCKLSQLVTLEGLWVR